LVAVITLDWNLEANVLGDVLFFGKTWKKQIFLKCAGHIIDDYTHRGTPPSS
jgi:hypothetical protein